ncbi:hypothetical protein RRG08_036631 [Elysia crispata]|uniref:Uncharacterized protein n=1 Tax=Elysia crispata TaxID=231223 RepID=A0AAE0YSU2_9GAST|nr:hypothetical protein RRG08_036631 [Elysia crispata]
MEEIDEVGEVDFGYDLASMMNDDDDDEEEEEVDVNDTDDVNKLEDCKPSSESSTQVQKAHALLTPTMRKVLAVASGSKIPTESTKTNKSGEANQVVTLAKKSLTPTPSKVTDAKAGPATKKTGTQANVKVVKPEVTKTKVSQSVESNKLPAKAASESQKALSQVKTNPSPSIRHTSQLQKAITLKQTSNVPGSLKSPKDLSNFKTVAKGVKTEPASPARTQGSSANVQKVVPGVKLSPTTRGSSTGEIQSKGNEVCKSSLPASSKTLKKPALVSAPSSTSLSTHKQMPTTSTSKVPVEPKTTAANSTRVSSSQAKTSATNATRVNNPQAKTTATNSTCVNSPQAKTTVTKVPLVDKAVIIVKPDVSSKSVETSISVSSANPVASNLVIASSTTVKSAMSTSIATSSTDANQVPSVKTLPSTSSVKQTKPDVKSILPAVITTKNTSPGADVVKNTDSPKVSGSSVAEALSGTPPSGPTAPVIKATVDESSKLTAVAIQSTASSMSTTKTTSTKTVAGKSTIPTTAEANKFANPVCGSRIPLLPTPPSRAAVLSANRVGGTRLLPVAVRKPGPPSISKTTSPREVLAKSTASTAAASKSIAQTASATKIPLLATPSSKTTILSTTVVKTPKSASDLTKSSISMSDTGKNNPSVASAKIKSGTVNPLLYTGLKKQEDRASSPCIAEVMALDVGKDALEDMDLGLTMSLDDKNVGFSDGAESNNKKVIAFKKRPASPPKTGPPIKTKPEVSSSNLPKVKDSVDNSKHRTLPTPANSKKEESVKHEQIDQAITDSVSKITAPQSQTSTNTKVLSKPTGKRIVRRFHRASQTLSKHLSSKLLQCLIRIPALDAPQKAKSTVSVAANLSSEDSQKPFYVSPLPPTVRQDVLDAVLLFNTNQTEARHIKPEVTFTHGISIGHITQADIEKSLFRENIVSRSSFYNFQFNGQDGVMDLYFKNEDAFQAVMTQIRKTKIGPRYLPVTFFKTLNKDEQDPDCPQPFARATVLFDQNFSSSSFLGYAKAIAGLIDRADGKRDHSAQWFTYLPWQELDSLTELMGREITVHNGSPICLGKSWTL